MEPILIFLLRNRHTKRSVKSVIETHRRNCRRVNRVDGAEEINHQSGVPNGQSLAKLNELVLRSRLHFTDEPAPGQVPAVACRAAPDDLGLKQ